MTTNEAPPADPPHPYTETGLARLMLSDAYRETADFALGGISPGADSHARPGEFAEQALRTLRRAENALRWAVVYERERGTSWDDIGDALGPVTRQSAHRRFADVVEQWRAPLEDPESVRLDGTPEDPRIPYPASAPEEGATSLDRWLLAHSAPYDSWAEGEQPVSGYLERHSTTSALIATRKYTERLLKDQMVPDPQKEADAADFHADLLERLVREGEAPPVATEWITKDRVRAKALRQTPGHGVTWEDMDTVKSDDQR
ncbi:hypothetical protein OG413_46110 [Streptomyces sp. NBC_01433]|uniref:hypothetical protein n=1 Tax=Streptomyces sp. NBC_01433 TaxID=2903864 RepID=UPI00225592C9|nr:hypothetical protein [Streptomyces sp. NBC_01433]MCX4682562.1 hypothetical protein [Streptomyces sp. NBC_01433]